jgi:site-specific recombinase XerD
VARRALRRAGVEAPTQGAHVFRHSAATGLLRRGMPLQGIAELLRHTSHESVFHYAKVHADLLGSVARPWPEATDAEG